MDTANDTSFNSLTIEKEISQLISKISDKELDFFSDENIEVLHDLRVDLRKLRTWLYILRSNGYPIKKLYKHTVHCHNLGSDLRNLDVLMHWIKTNAFTLSPRMIHIFKHEQTTLKKAFLKELVHKNSLQKLRILGRDLLKDLQGVTKNDLEPYVVEFINKKRESLHRILPNISGEMDQLHKIRKLLKKVRYASYLLPIKNNEYKDSLKYLQEILGYINDRRIWIKLIHTHLKKNKETIALKDIFTADIEKRIKEFKELIASQNVYF